MPVEVCNDFGCASNPNGFLYEGVSDDFLRGDVDLNAVADINDARRLVQFLFLGVAIDSCQDAADVDDNGSPDLVDPLRLLFFLFASAPPPASPYPNAGPDPTPDGLTPCL